MSLGFGLQENAAQKSRTQIKLLGKAQKYNREKGKKNGFLFFQKMTLLYSLFSQETDMEALSTKFKVNLTRMGGNGPMSSMGQNGS